MPADITDGITRITVKGFKSIAKEIPIDIKPLTVLAGANSSGKSSIMQPLLLLKQTLEAPFDPADIWLGGAHIEFTSADEFLSRVRAQSQVRALTVDVEGVSLESDIGVRVEFERSADGPLAVRRSIERGPDGSIDLSPGLTPKEIAARVPTAYETLRAGIPRLASHEWSVVRDRCFLMLQLEQGSARGTRAALRMRTTADAIGDYLRRIVHVGGRRGLPGRAYPRTATGPLFDGPFNPYTASMLEHWQTESPGTAEAVAQDLRCLRLTKSVRAERRDDASLNIMVGRLPVDSQQADDEVNIADVGLGVPHVLPVLIALRAAEAGRLVYIEQPEIHLHPRAQVALAGILAESANRGVRVVVETHSALLLLAIQTLLADPANPLSPQGVALHWFSRRDDGVTEVTTAEIDESGAFGDWPQDFGEVTMDAQIRYLEHAEARQD